MLTAAARSLGAAPGPVMTVAALAIAVLSLATVERDTGANSFATGARGRVRLGPVPFWGGLIVLIAFMSENAAENWSALHIERTLGGSPAAGSLGPAALALTMGLGRIFGQTLVAGIDDRRLLGWGAAVAAAGMALAGLAPVTWLAYLGLIVVGLGGSVLAPTAFTLIGRLSPPDLRARMIARATALGYMGYFFGPPVLGLISEFAELRFSFVAMAVAILAINLLVPPLMRAGSRSETR
jgi:MFS family permease